MIQNTKQGSTILTIITICLNDRTALEKTIKSILEQTFWKEKNNIHKADCLIVDGGSTDSTLEYIHDLKDWPLNISYISEPDNGIYDAMNKGIKLCHGKWIHFLNAGDIFSNTQSLGAVMDVLEKSPADIVYGNAVKYDKWHSEKTVPRKLADIKKGMILCHQAVFFRKDIHKNYLYSSDYKLVSDYNTILNLYMDGRKFEYANIDIVNYDMMGISGNDILKTYEEIRRVRDAHGLIRHGFIDMLVHGYGIAKRKVLMGMPQALRWKIVSVKRKVTNQESVH